MHAYRTCKLLSVLIHQSDTHYIIHVQYSFNLLREYRCSKFTNKGTVVRQIQVKVLNFQAEQVLPRMYNVFSKYQFLQTYFFISYAFSLLQLVSSTQVTVPQFTNLDALQISVSAVQFVNFNYCVYVFFKTFARTLYTDHTFDLLNW